MRILKFGGTSVGAPERMHQVAQLIEDEHPKIVVLSAVSGTTNSLVEICNAYYRKELKTAEALIDALEKKYTSFLIELYADLTTLEQAQEFLKEKFAYLRSFKGQLFTAVEEKIVLAQGELISTHLFHWYAETIALPTKLLSALKFMRTLDGEPDMEKIKEGIQSVMQGVGPSKIYITQGYICQNEYGGIDNLQRGGSDYTASLIGAAVQAEEIQIWTDIDGMHNNDPRVVQPTFPIEKLTFEEAAELAYFGAKILHPSSVLPAQKANVPVRLLNTMEPTAKGTLISKSTTSTKGVAKAVAAKDGITAIKIRSSRMLLAYGFLHKVFEIFERYKTPIDMITTSEVAVSLTIDDDSQLANIEKELSDFGTVEIDKNQTIVCVVGTFTHDNPGVAVQVLEPLKEIPIRMICSGGSQSNISVLMDRQYKEAALKLLNEGLFNL